MPRKLTHQKKKKRDHPLRILTITTEENIHTFNGRLVCLFPLRGTPSGYKALDLVIEQQMNRAVDLGAVNPFPIVACFGEALLILDLPGHES